MVDAKVSTSIQKLIGRFFQASIDEMRESWSTWELPSEILLVFSNRLRRRVGWASGRLVTLTRKLVTKPNAMAIVFSHELRHIFQFANGYRKSREVDADKFALTVCKKLGITFDAEMANDYVYFTADGIELKDVAGFHVRDLEAELRQIREQLQVLTDMIMEQRKEQLKPRDWWKPEYIKQFNGFLGNALLMALAINGGFDSIQQWIKVCGKIPRATFYLLRKELVELGLIDRETMTKLTDKGSKVTKIMRESPLPIIFKTQLLDIMENLEL